MDHNPLSTAELAALSTEQRNSASAWIDQVSTRELVAIINREDARVATAVEAELDSIARAVDMAVERIQRGGRLIYIGAGTSGRLGVLDASECPPTFGTDPSMVLGIIAGGDTALRNSIEGAEDDPAQGEMALRKLEVSGNDVIVGIAASGRTPFVLGAIAYARSVGAATIGLGNSPNSKLSSAVDIAITPLPGPEVITGSTRMKAGTSQKLVLNMLSSGVMIKLGKTFGNLMVDVKTSNAKLQTRAVHIVAEATGIGDQAAAVVLAVSDNEVKTAIVSVLSGIAPDQARDRLALNDGIVARAIANDFA
ncbi:MAG: N-acetylmuramic acid 6-phosphate etherase [Thermomicrobiales bacterium]